MSFSIFSNILPSRHLFSILFHTHTVDAILCFLSIYTLKVTRFKVPPEMLTTQPGQLICEFEISRGERLYSLRWYLNETEFFRFEPRADQRVQLFPLPQLKIDVRLAIKLPFLKEDFDNI